MNGFWRDLLLAVFLCIFHLRHYIGERLSYVFNTKLECSRVWRGLNIQGDSFIKQYSLFQNKTILYL